MQKNCPTSSFASLPVHRRAGGFTLVEVMVAAMLLVLLCGASTQAFAYINRRAAISRLGVNARTVVERNITRALNSPFSATQVPTMLAVTAADGVPYDEDGNGDNVVALVIQDTGGPVMITATMTRTVVAITNPELADIRQVTFRINYTYRGRPYSYQMSTVRART